MTQKEYLEKIGMEIKVARVRAKLRRSQLCKLSGVNKSTLGDVENGTINARISTYKMIVDALGLEMKSIL